MPRDRIAEIKVYDPPNKGGGLLMHLWFRSEHSRDMDLEIFLERRQRGEVGRIVLIDCVNFTTTEM